MKKIIAKVKKQDEPKKINTAKAIWQLLIGKKETNGNAVPSYFALLVDLIFKTLAAFCVILFCFTIIAIFDLFETKMPFLWILSSFVFYILLALIFVLFFVMYLVMGREIREETDKNYIVSVFSALVSFAALVVAFVALVKK